ncbi:hypothetical protein RSOLAG22IIIB_10090 [Rhizoctonia solani]|uniref:Uncharacterized protein n=1 Tax=Rhizoctonia solani TaxID=456999 RepID=A0A0K6G0Q9_9AGAM|nr:hypothetical protein RSOLAG22IIIB_10090 [Rhizoctonia solani]
MPPPNVDDELLRDIYHHGTYGHNYVAGGKGQTGCDVCDTKAFIAKRESAKKMVDKEMEAWLQEAIKSIPERDRIWEY